MSDVRFKYDKRFRNYAESLIADIKPITEMKEVDDFYFSGRITQKSLIDIYSLI